MRARATVAASEARSEAKPSEVDELTWRRQLAGAHAPLDLDVVIDVRGRVVLVLEDAELLEALALAAARAGPRLLTLGTIFENSR